MKKLFILILILSSFSNILNSQLCDEHYMFYVYQTCGNNRSLIGVTNESGFKIDYLLDPIYNVSWQNLKFNEFCFDCCLEFSVLSRSNGFNFTVIPERNEIENKFNCVFVDNNNNEIIKEINPKIYEENNITYYQFCFNDLKDFIFENPLLYLKDIRYLNDFNFYSSLLDNSIKNIRFNSTQLSNINIDKLCLNECVKYKDIVSSYTNDKDNYNYFHFECVGGCGNTPQNCSKYPYYFDLSELELCADQIGPMTICATVKNACGEKKLEKTIEIKDCDDNNVKCEICCDEILKTNSQSEETISKNGVNISEIKNFCDLIIEYHYSDGSIDREFNSNKKLISYTIYSRSCNSCGYSRLIEKPTLNCEICCQLISDFLYEIDKYIFINQLVIPDNISLCPDFYLEIYFTDGTSVKYLTMPKGSINLNGKKISSIGYGSNNNKCKKCGMFIKI